MIVVFSISLLLCLTDVAVQLFGNDGVVEESVSVMLDVTDMSVGWCAVYPVVNSKPLLLLDYVIVLSGVRLLVLVDSRS